MNLDLYRRHLDMGGVANLGWASRPTEFAENFGVAFDAARAPDHYGLYQQAMAAKYQAALARYASQTGRLVENPFAVLQPGDTREAFLRWRPDSELPDAYRAKVDALLAEARATDPEMPDPALFDTAIAGEAKWLRRREAEIGSGATGWGAAGGFAGGSAGTMTQPVQLAGTIVTLPVGGVAWGAARSVAARILGTAATEAGLSAGIQAGAEAIDYPLRRRLGTEASGEEIASNILMAGAGGALLGGAFRGGAEIGRVVLPSLRETLLRLRSRGDNLGQAGRDAEYVLQGELQLRTTGPGDNIVAHGRAVEAAMADVADGLSVDVARLQAAVRSIDANPIGDPLEPLIDLTTADLERVIVARGGFRNINELEVNRHGWGLVKVLWEHGWKSGKAARHQVTETDILALPEVLRSKQPLPPDPAHPARMNWVVERESPFGTRRILYAAKRFDGASDRTLVTIFVVEPDGPNARLPLSEDVRGNAGGLPVSSGDGPNAPKDTAAASAQPATRGQASLPAGENIGRSGARGKAASISAGNRVFTASGRAIDTRFELVEADRLVASHGDDLTHNPAFPADLQPRDRARAASGAQIQDIAARLQPERLTGGADAGGGAPIIGTDDVVESGNGRVLAIRRAYGQVPGRAEAYRPHLAELGFDVAGYEKPILIRRRQTALSPEERAAFVREANTAGIGAMSVTERALSDARLLPDSALDLYLGGEIEAAANRPFVRAFMEALPPSEHGGLVQASGEISKAGIDRIRAAMLARAYGDADFLAKLTEATDSNVVAIGKALVEVAPAWAQMRARAAASDIAPEVDATTELLTAMRAVDQAREAGQPVRDLILQGEMFGSGLTEIAQGFLRTFYRDADLRKAAGQARIVTELRHYIDEANKTQAGVNMFGEAPLSPAEILAGRVGDGRAEAAAAAEGLAAFAKDADAAAALEVELARVLEAQDIELPAGIELVDGEVAVQVRSARQTLKEIDEEIAQMQSVNACAVGGDA